MGRGNEWNSSNYRAFSHSYTLSIMGTHQLAIYAMTALLPALTGGMIIHGLLLLMAILVFEIPMVWLIDSRICFLTGRQGRRGK